MSTRKLWISSLNVILTILACGSAAFAAAKSNETQVSCSLSGYGLPGSTEVQMEKSSSKILYQGRLKLKDGGIARIIFEPAQTTSDLADLTLTYRRQGTSPIHSRAQASGLPQTLTSQIYLQSMRRFRFHPGGNGRGL